MRLECDCRLIQRTSGDFLTTCKLFDFLLVQLAVFVALGHCDEAFALQPGEGRTGGFCVLLTVSTANHTDRGNLGIVTEHSLDGVEQSRLTVTSGLTMKNEHTLLVTHTQHGITQSSLKEVCLVLVILCNLFNELLPAFTLNRLGDSVAKCCLHGEKIVPAMFPEGEVSKVVCTIETVNEIGVCVKLHSRDTKLTCCVLEDSISHTPVTHLIDEPGVGLSGIIVLDFSAVENHQTNEIFNLLGHENCSLVLTPCSLVIGVPALVFRAVASFVRIEQAKQVCHTHFRPLKPGAGLVCFLGVILLNQIHLRG